jgi:hypothetical protein
MTSAQGLHNPKSGAGQNQDVNGDLLTGKADFDWLDLVEDGFPSRWQLTILLEIWSSLLISY